MNKVKINRAETKRTKSNQIETNKKTRTPISTLALAWAALAGNLIVILQGAVVRATGSGAGCGAHWPSCNGVVIPLAPSTETLIEYSHRLLSLGVLLMGVWVLSRVWRSRKENRGLFVFGLASFVLLIIEALLGAATVLLGLTGDTVSVGRGLMVATHLVNSMLLVGALTLTIIYARQKRPWPLNLAKQGTLTTALCVGLVGMLVLMFSGGIAAMGNTMFPSESLSAGLAADFDSNSHPLIRLRILHPLIAITIGIYLYISLGYARWLKPAPEANGVLKALVAVYVFQLAVGTANLALLAPVALQLLHLATAVAAFGLLTATSAYTLGSSAPLRQGRTLERLHTTKEPS